MVVHSNLEAVPLERAISTKRVDQMQAERNDRQKMNMRDSLARGCRGRSCCRAGRARAKYGFLSWKKNNARLALSTL